MSTDIEIMSGDDAKTLVAMIHPGFPRADDVLRIQPLLRADLGEEQRLSGKAFWDKGRAWKVRPEPYRPEKYTKRPALTKRKSTLPRAAFTLHGGCKVCQLLCDIRTRRLVCNLGRARRFKHGNPLAPASARQSKSVLNEHLAGYEWPVAIVDRDKMLVMKRQMAWVLVP
jgi:hypothetical protein